MKQGLEIIVSESDEETEQESLDVKIVKKPVKKARAVKYSDLRKNFHRRRSQKQLKEIHRQNTQKALFNNDSFATRLENMNRMLTMRGEAKPEELEVFSAGHMLEWGTLTAPYRDRYEWWTLVVLVRKFVLAAILGLGSSFSFQVNACLIVICIYALSLIILRPFHHRIYAIQETLYLLSVIILYGIISLIAAGESLDLETAIQVQAIAFLLHVIINIVYCGSYFHELRHSYLDDVFEVRNEKFNEVSIKIPRPEVVNSVVIETNDEYKYCSFLNSHYYRRWLLTTEDFKSYYQTRNLLLVGHRVAKPTDINASQQDLLNGGNTSPQKGKGKKRLSVIVPNEGAAIDFDINSPDNIEKLDSFTFRRKLRRMESQVRLKTKLSSAGNDGIPSSPSPEHRRFHIPDAYDSDSIEELDASVYNSNSGYNDMQSPSINSFSTPKHDNYLNNNASMTNSRTHIRNHSYSIPDYEYEYDSDE